MIDIRRASTREEVSSVRVLFEEYAASLELDLDFQGFASEVDSLPGDYACPRGVLLLALDDTRPVGCVALRPFDWPDIAELKRLYVRPEVRGERLGQRLSLAALAFARDAGYGSVRLDTLPTMGTAMQLYERLGFREIGPYRFNPVPGTRYMELDLRSAGDGLGSSGQQ